jgi:phosphoglycolate phosphatase
MYESSPAKSPLAHWRGRPLRAVLFDLDGTLFDTLEDIAAALNAAIEIRGWRPFAADEVRRMIGRGSPVLVHRAAEARGEFLDADAEAQLLQRFFHHYEDLERSGRSSARPYDGAADILSRLHRAGVRTAVVTNKQHRFAAALIESRGFSGWIDVIVGGDSCARRKPDPQPLLYACDALQVSNTQCLMIGDSSNDVEAARGAGIPVVCVSYGYNEDREPRTLACDTLIDSLAELGPLLFETTSAP